MTKKTYKLYLTEFSPNGTNDLIVVDLNGRVIDCLESVAFGYSKNKPDASIMSDDAYLSGIEELEDAYSQDLGITALYEINLNTILKNICVSPIDPSGRQILKSLSLLIDSLDRKAA